MGGFLFATSSGLATLRHDAAQRAHGPAHAAVDGGAAGPRARRAGDAGAAHAARRPRGWLLAVLHSRVAKVLSFPPLAFALYVVSPWALYFTGWYDASLDSPFVHEMMHVHLVHRRRAVLLAADGHRPGPGPGGLPVPGAADLADAAVPRVPGRHDHEPHDADRRRPTTSRCARDRWVPGCPTALDDQHLAGGILWAPATWSGWCSSGCCSPSGCAPR